MTINELCKIAYEAAKDKGWFDTPRALPEICSRLHAEISEILRETEKGHRPTHTYYSGTDDKPEGVPSEFADLFIYAASVCGWLGLDMEATITQKMQYNRTRPYRHGKVL